MHARMGPEVLLFPNTDLKSHHCEEFWLTEYMYTKGSVFCKQGKQQAHIRSVTREGGRGFEANPTWGPHELALTTGIHSIEIGSS